VEQARGCPAPVPPPHEAVRSVPVMTAPLAPRRRKRNNTGTVFGRGSLISGPREGTLPQGRLVVEKGVVSSSEVGKHAPSLRDALQRCRAGALGALRVAGRGHQGRRSRRWRRPCAWPILLRWRGVDARGGAAGGDTGHVLCLYAPGTPCARWFVQATHACACASIDGQQRTATLSLLAPVVIAQLNRLAEGVSASGGHKRDGRGRRATALDGRATRPPARTSCRARLPRRRPSCFQNVCERRASLDAGIGCGSSRLGIAASGTRRTLCWSPPTANAMTHGLEIAMTRRCGPGHRSASTAASNDGRCALSIADGWTACDAAGSGGSGVIGGGARGAAKGEGL
jgi:hypothetical protein